LQSKIVRAKERIEAELGGAIKSEAAKAAEGGAAGAEKAAGGESTTTGKQ
jgi:hypothetical protein